MTNKVLFQQFINYFFSKLYSNNTRYDISLESKIGFSKENQKLPLIFTKIIASFFSTCSYRIFNIQYNVPQEKTPYTWWEIEILSFTFFPNVFQGMSFHSVWISLDK